MVNLAKMSRQETGSYCGPAVMQMLVAQLGKEVSQVQIVEACAATKTVMELGIPLFELAVGIKKMFPGLQVWEKQSASVSDIKMLVDAGYPVAVDWQGIFTTDEYGDEIWNTRSKLVSWWRKIQKEPEVVGDQGHYCVVTEVDEEKGFIRFVDPYGHYAGKERFVAIWEFEERWWDDRVGVNDEGKKAVIFEDKLIFLVTDSKDNFPESVGMKRI